MEISRPSTSVFSASAESLSTLKLEPKAAAKATALNNQPEQTEPSLEDLQQAMRELPEVDMDQVTAIKQALARGELHCDVQVLARSLLSYHRASDV